MVRAEPDRIEIRRLAVSCHIGVPDEERAVAQTLFLSLTIQPWHDFEAAQDRIVEWRTLSNRYVQLPTVKTMLAKRYDNMGWLNLMPPLVELTEAEREDVWAEMQKLEA